MEAHETARDVARVIKRGGFGSIVAAFLEAASPLRVLGAQFAFVFDPLLGGRDRALLRFGQVLEDDEAFSVLLDDLKDEGYT